MSRPMTSRRAMTLIEVLAATVLLATLGGVCASMLRSVPMRPGDSPIDATSIDMLAIQRAADALLDVSDFRERVIADSNAEFETGWPEESARPSIRVRRVQHESSADEPTHAWVVFSCDQFVVWRCIELPREKASP